MNNTRIDWCDSTWNPVTGCKGGCDYCYARSIAKHFGGRWDETLNRSLGADGGIHEIESQMTRHTSGKNRSIPVHSVAAPYPFVFDPTFHRYRLEEPLKKQKGQNIFVGSMADLFGRWVPTKWIVEVLDICRKAPQHNYLFLTKFPERYVELDHLALLPHEENFWYGATITNAKQMKRAADSIGQLPQEVRSFFSMEPLMEDVARSEAWEMPYNGAYANWIIIGAMTGPGSESQQPCREWVERIVDDAKNELSPFYPIPVFMKDNLRKVWGRDLIQEFPEKLEAQR